MTASKGMGAGGVLALALASACNAPPVQISADRINAPAAIALSGQVIVEGPNRGDALILLYDAAHPPPPTGSAAPISFVQIPAADVFGTALTDASQIGPFSAAFAFPQVSSGTYLVAAFLDGDTCYEEPGDGCRSSDFEPFYDVTREPNGVDLLGGHVDAQNNLVPVVVPPPGPDGFIGAVSQVQVVLGQSVPDRPAFAVATASSTLNTSAPTPVTLSVEPIVQAPVFEEQPIFLLKYVDDNNDGIPDVGADGAPLLWPKVFLRKVQEPATGETNPLLQAGLRDENDPNNTGVLIGGGVTYPPATSPSAVILPTGYLQEPPPSDPTQTFYPSQLYARLANAQGQPDVTKVAYLETLELAVLPAALDASNPAQPLPLAAVPPGRYAIYVQQFTGQTWRLPNELAPSIAPGLGILPLAGQDRLFTWGM